MAVLGPFCSRNLVSKFEFQRKGKSKLRQDKSEKHTTDFDWWNLFVFEKFRQNSANQIRFRRRFSAQLWNSNNVNTTPTSLTANSIDVFCSENQSHCDFSKLTLQKPPDFQP